MTILSGILVSRVIVKLQSRSVGLGNMRRRKMTCLPRLAVPRRMPVISGRVLGNMASLKQRAVNSAQVCRQVKCLVVVYVSDRLLKASAL